jgi:hypothetical protein
MLNLGLFKKKKLFTKSNGDQVVDLTSGTFNSNTLNSAGTSYIAVNEDEVMRPDLVANRIYGDHNKFDAILKFNGISNPFSVDYADILMCLPYSSIESMFTPPKTVPEKGVEKKTSEESIFNNPKTTKDQARLDDLKKKAGAAILPPNVNQPGSKNVKIKDGKVVFGEDVTTINSKNCPAPISRTRLQEALIKNKLF